jgi:CHASE2 domain-containing sensor protein
MHTGKFPIHSNGFIGKPTDYAARIAALADNGQILLSETTAVLVRDGEVQGLALHNHDRHLLKGIGRPQVFELLYPGKQPQAVRDNDPTRPQVVVPVASATALVLTLGLRLLGLLQPWELQAFDQLMRWRPLEEPDPRILMITVTPADVDRQDRDRRRGQSLEDGMLAQLLQRLQPLEPRMIGLNLYHEAAIDPTYPDLVTQFQTNDRLIVPCEYGPEGEAGVAPPPDSPLAQVGFSDLVIDQDGLVRRHLLAMNPHAESRCQTDFAFSIQVVLGYLAAQGIAPSFTPTGDLQLGSRIFPRMASDGGGYRGVDANGYQLLLNYRATPHLDQIAFRLTLGEALNGGLTSELVKDKIVLIGTIDPSYKDLHRTPYGNHALDKTFGLIIQAHQISQLLSAIEDNRPLLWSWSESLEVLWIGLWAVVGGGVAWVGRSRPLVLGLGPWG